MLYYKKITIPNFESIQKALQNLTDGKFEDQSKLAYYDPSFNDINECCQELHSWLLERSHFRINFYRVYSTAPCGKFGMHIDGGAFERCFTTLNIPISGYVNSTTMWWDESNAKMEHFMAYQGVAATRILNPTELVCLDKVEVNQPMMIRSDFIHSVENPNSIPRLCLTVRWWLDRPVKSFEEVLNA